ncbi:cytochrome c3 family protein, partial [Chloroflexota bacterium]
NHGSYQVDSCLDCHSIAGPPGETALSDDSCLQCHTQRDISMALPSGERLPLYIDPQVYSASVHADKLLCTDCHNVISGYPHPEIDISSRREYNIAQYELCKKCHFDNYTKTLDSIHYKMLSDGDLRSPLCTDCHGSHDVTLPSQPRANISQTCSQCHQPVYREYVDSVHGRALLEKNNNDVPVCTDCHQSHTIEDPRTASFRLESVHVCSNCHSNESLMQEYGISSEVVKTYLNDFHGRTVALMEKEARDIWVEEAVCTDCHGIHDIQPVDNPNSSVIKENLVNTCRKCHSDATENFPGAWLSHYEPSISKAPLIFFVRWFYRILIPFILVGLSVHVLFDLWRRITNR